MVVYKKLEVKAVNVILDECNELNDLSFMKDGMQYPCVIIDGITSNNEIVFFRNHSKKTDSSVPAYMLVSGEPVSLGYFDLVLDNLLAIREIYDYKVRLYKEKDGEGIWIDLDNPDTLIKFIRL